jgi:hypothetical protein
MKRDWKQWIVPLLFAAAVLAEATFASAITITGSASAPGTNVVVSQTARDSSSDLQWRSDFHQSFGQTFTAPSNFVLDKISYLVFQENAADRSDAGLTMKVDVFNAASQAATSGTSLLSGGESGVTPAFGKGAFRWLTFDITDVALTSGSVYGITIDFAFLLDHPGVAGGHKIGGDDPAGMQFLGGNAFGGGQAFRLFNGSSNMPENQDLAFVLQEAEVVIPEPASSVLFLVGAMIACKMRSRSPRQ